MVSKEVVTLSAVPEHNGAVIAVIAEMLKGKVNPENVGAPDELSSSNSPTP